ncbi:MAG: hypothetical protein ABI142_07110, partial [Bryocella sp.]
MVSDWTDSLTAQRAHKPILIWKDCDSKVARALWEFQSECAETAPQARWRALPTIFRRHVDPALNAAFSAAGISPQLLTEVFGDGGIASYFSKPAALDRNLCLLNKLTNNFLAATTNTLREAVEWIEDHRPARVVPNSVKGMKGELRRVRGGEYGPCWPFCEYCGELSERALWLATQGAEKVPSGDLSRYSARICHTHKQKQGGCQRTARRQRLRFEKVLQALTRELSTDREFRRRFIDRAWEVDGATPLEPNDVLDFLMKHLDTSLIIDPVKAYARHCANRISREFPDDTALSVARLRLAGIPQSEIAVRLGVSRQAVSQRVAKSRGFYDFS